MSKFSMPKAFGMVTVGERGQIVIPANTRKLYHINPGDRLIVLAKEGGPIGLVPVEQFNEFLTQTTEMLAKVKKNT
ncbi:MAG: AbrB/MazE/SpoVT family DNA-binding domain-containing protein [Candidatus Omnitrophica bacterium]|nr:AbrB/MazE/SpoVT family DNA-binding domain-containing protein [Candidatus Omnitrophota bacterium]